MNFNALTDKDLDQDPGSLQSQIESIYQYSERWSLKINIGKTKLGVLEKRKKNMKSETSPIHNIYFDLCNHYELRSWATLIHSVIDHLGYTTIVQDCNAIIKYFPMLKQRLRDQYIQDWSTNIA